MRDKNLPVHLVERGDPKLNGALLSDVRADQERAYREARMKSSRVEGTKKVAAAKKTTKKAPAKKVTVKRTPKKAPAKKAQKGKK